MYLPTHTHTHIHTHKWICNNIIINGNLYSASFILGCSNMHKHKQSNVSRLENLSAEYLQRSFIVYNL